MSAPIGLRNILYDTFKGIICQVTPVVPPIIFAKCCKTILGCEHCLDTWYPGAKGQTHTSLKWKSNHAGVSDDHNTPIGGQSKLKDVHKHTR